MELKENEWNKSHQNKDNMNFYPNEEIIRFVSKYVRKRIGFNEFVDLQNYKTCLDLGCGTGRHVIYFDSMGFEAYGVDISEHAINIAVKWCESINKEYLKNRLTVKSITELPYQDGTFHMVISHGVLDSMEFTIAKNGIKEVARVMKKEGILYFNVIMNEELSAKEIIVKTIHEAGTIQSYFNKDKIEDMLDGKFEIIDFKIIEWLNDKMILQNRRAHVICKRK